MSKTSLTLYVAGNTPQSDRTIASLRQICEEELKGRCVLNIINVVEQPEIIEKEKILAIPALVKEEPPPVQRLIGDLSNREKIIRWIEITSG